MHYRINIVIPLIGSITKHLNDRFPNDVKSILYGLKLKCFVKDTICSIANEYINVILYPDDWKNEIHTWKNLRLLSALCQNVQ